MERWPIGIFTSVGAGLGASVGVAKEFGVPTVQLHTPPPAARTPARVAELRREFEDAGIQVTVVFAGFAGESYADIPTVGRTVGLVPRATRAVRLEETRAVADFAQAIGAEALGMHLGFVPEDPTVAEYAESIAVTRQVCDDCAARGLRFHLETGQESPAALLRLISDAGRENLAVNFDPANMILYGSGEPIKALLEVGRHVRSCHCKDAKWAANPGQEWGKEVPLGQGEVNMEAFLQTLKSIRYDGALTIECEIPGDDKKRHIAGAVALLSTLRAEVLGSD